ncbi:MAG: LamG-like jellyroll fold domain-containing protein [Candidatus Saccharimonadales bacterium]
MCKFIHHHVAHRPHQHLMKHIAWYRKWHGWRYHKHVHFSILLMYLFSVGTVVLFSFSNTMAASVIDSKDFSNADNFSFNSNTIEINGTSARLKAQNYVSDANTMALYHLDEDSGSVMSDSSGNSNNGLIRNGTFGVGNLNNGLGLNGTDSRAAFADSASLSLSQSNTLEAWVKFDSSLSAGSTAQRQAIFDKGDYQLYFDNESGKLTYELAKSEANSWEQVGGNDLNGGWDLNGKRSVNAITKAGSYTYVGIGIDIGDAEVWRYDGSSWLLVGGGVNSVNDSWSAQTYEGVYSLASDGTNIYAGLGISAADGEVWKFNGTSWNKIGGDSLNGSWTNYAEQVVSLDYFGGNLYAGIGTSANDAEVWRWNGSSWTQIGGDSKNSGWTINYELVGGITNDGTYLYAGLGTTAGDSEVWRWSGSAWNKIGGDSLNGSWDTTIETIRSLRYFGGSLYAGLGDTAGDAEVWRWNGSAWNKIGGDGDNNSWADGTYEQVTALAWDGSNLFASLGTGNGDGEVWSYNGSIWTQIGGDSLNGSWATTWGDSVNSLYWDGSSLLAGTYDSAGSGWVYSWDGSSWDLIAGNYVNNSWGFYNFAAVQVMQDVGDYLYVGMGNVAGSAAVMRYDGSTWSLIGGQGVNNSWNSNIYEQVMSMASYNGNLIVGLGTTANTTDSDGEVWSFNGSTWTKIGGQGVNSSWPFTASHYGEVESLTADDDYLYAGLGLGANDGEVWRFDGTVWDKIGGDSLNGGWTNYAENVYSLAFYDGNLIAGLGRSTGDSEVWSWNGSAWTKIGGDGQNSSWNTYQSIESMVTYGDFLYAGLGNITGSATLWRYDGSSWLKIGGDDVNNSWTVGTYEKVKTMAVYNGSLFVGLGNGAGDGEAWRYNEDGWTKVAGSSVNGGWTGTIEEVESFSIYKGKLYAGTGLSGNADANVWAWGDNGFLQSNANSFDTSWHHVAATYDGMTMKLYIDGQLDGSKSVSLDMPDSSQPLYIGTSQGGREYGKKRGYFAGDLDELRISNVARSNFIDAPYSKTRQTITLADAIFTNNIQNFVSFSADETLNGGSIGYRLSNDNGSSWLYWNGDNWATSESDSFTNEASVIDEHFSSFPVTFDGLIWQVVISSDGNQRVYLNSVTAEANTDIVAPDINASNIVAKKANGGSDLAAGTWTNGASPYFSWDAGNDADSGILGYCLYIGQDESANLVTTAGHFGASLIDAGGNCQFATGDNHVDLAMAGVMANPLVTSSESYYLLVQAIDKAGNLYPTASSFNFKFDNTPPSNPGFISSPSGFINTKEATLTWPTSGDQAPSDSASGLVGLQYRIGNTTWYGDSHSGTGDISDLLVNDGAYTTIETPDFANIVDGVNTVYFRTWDLAGNVNTNYVSAVIKVNTSNAPSEPQSVTANPVNSSQNSFSFSWQPPTTFVGDVKNLNYCYTINTLPSVATCNYSGAGIASLSAGPYATQPGENTLYVVAKDESGNINYSSIGSVVFSADTSAPGIPGNVDIVDVSIKSTSNWRLAITWDEPVDVGVGVSSYKIYRSTDNLNFSVAGTSSSTTYIDAGLTQRIYYYQVTACDSTNNCSAVSTTVSMLPTGKFIEPATLLSEPQAGDITTRRATIQWTTDRGSDSKVSIGTESGKYSPSEIGSSDQVIIHSIELDNLAAGTIYYYHVKWTDEDGNTGTSQEYTFTTQPAPVVKEISAIKVSLSGAIIQFTSIGANKVNLYFGESDSFGGLKSVNTSSSESTYNIEPEGLKDGTKYYYSLSSFDGEGNEYKGNVFSFVTPQRPRITDLRFQPVEGEPTSTQSVTWVTNVPTSSTVTYGRLGTASVDIQVSKLETSHKIVISGLEDDSDYFLLAQGRDVDGNLAVSDRQAFRTELDTRPPSVSDINIESSIKGTGSEARGQVIVSWRTDEPSTSQIGYGEGSTITSFNNKTSEDTQLTTEHIVVVSNLPTSKVYSLQVMSYDKAQNLGVGESQATIIGHADESVITVIMDALQRIFGL